MPAATKRTADTGITPMNGFFGEEAGVGIAYPDAGVPKAAS